MRRNSHTHRRFLNESDGSVYDAVEKICNDPRLFKKYFYDGKSGLESLIHDCYIECNDDLEFHAETMDLPADKLMSAVLRSIREDGKHNKPLQRGDINCYYLYDSEYYDAGTLSFQTFDTEKEWLEAVREYCCEKRIWEYEDEVNYSIDADIVLKAL